MKSRVFCQCLSRWNIFPGPLRSCVLFQVILYHYGNPKPLICFKKWCLFLTVPFSASQIGSTCTFQERIASCTKISFSGNDRLGQCFSNFTGHMNHLGILAKCRFWGGGGVEILHFQAAPRWCWCSWSDHILSSKDLGDWINLDHFPK